MDKFESKRVKWINLVQNGQIWATQGKFELKLANFSQNRQIGVKKEHNYAKISKYEPKWANLTKNEQISGKKGMFEQKWTIFGKFDWKKVNLSQKEQI